MNILLTGNPGVGKTTVIQKVIHLLRREPWGQSLKASGFYTAEIREGGKRKGFKIITLDGREGVLSHADIRSRHRVGKYYVDIEALEKLAIPCICPDLNVNLIVIDEIGKMECFSEEFRRAVVAALDSSSSVLATISVSGDEFMRALKARDDVHLLELTETNRDAMPRRILELIRRL